MSNYSIPLRYGFIGGFVICIISILSYMFYNQLFGSFFIQMAFGLFTFAVFIFIPVWGMVSYKREVGRLSFLQAFTGSMIIILITLACSSFISYLIPNVIDKEYPVQLYEKVRDSTAESMEKFGAPDEQIEKAMDKIKLEDFQPTLLSTLRSIGIGAGMGALLSLIIAAFVSRPDKQQPTLNTE